MTLRAYFEDIDGNAILDPEFAIEWITNIRFGSLSPKGYGSCSFQMSVYDPLEYYVIQEDCGVILIEGADIVYEGRIEEIRRVTGGTEEYLEFTCYGWEIIFEERALKAVWVDIAGVPNLEWPTSLKDDITQTSFVYEYRNEIIVVRMGSGDVARTIGDDYRESYILPENQYIKKVELDYRHRSGEGISFYIYSVDQASNEYVVHPADGTGSISHTFTLGNTNSFELEIRARHTDTYDQNDYFEVWNLDVYTSYQSTHSAYGSEAYSSGEILEDLLILVGSSAISSDYGDIANPGLTLNPYGWERFTYAIKIIEDIMKRGDASLNTWVFHVWDRTNASDNKPKIEFKAISTTTANYRLSLGRPELRRLAYHLGGHFINNVIVEYTDQTKKQIRSRTAADNSDFQNTASIADHYQRDEVIRSGMANTARADEIGERFINFHDERVMQGSFSVTGEIETSSGAMVPVSWIRAGDVIKITNLGENFYLRQVEYDVNSDTATLSPYYTDDNLSMMIAQINDKLRP